MNYTEAGVYELDLQSTAKRIYYSLIYRSTFYKFLNDYVDFENTDILFVYTLPLLLLICFSISQKEEK